MTLSLPTRLLVAFLLCLVAIVLLNIGGSLYFEGRVLGTWLNPDVVGTFLVVSAVSAVILATRKQ